MFNNYILQIIIEPLNGLYLHLCHYNQGLFRILNNPCYNNALIIIVITNNNDIVSNNIIIITITICIQH